MSWYSLYWKIRRHPLVIGIAAAGVAGGFPTRVTEITEKIEAIGWPQTFLDAARLSVAIIGLIVLFFGLLDWLKRALRRRVLLPDIDIIFGAGLTLGAFISVYFAWPYLGHMPILYFLAGGMIFLGILFRCAFSTPQKITRQSPLFDSANEHAMRNARELEYQSAFIKTASHLAQLDGVIPPPHYSGASHRDWQHLV